VNILIFDDDKLVSTSLKIILEADAGIKVVGVGNSGKDAIEFYEKLCLRDRTQLAIFFYKNR